MDDALVEVGGEEARLMVAQFLGQSMGFLKEIDKNITNKTNTLQGLTMDPVDIINKLPGGQQISRQPQQQPAQFIPPAVTAPNITAQSLSSSPQITIQPQSQPSKDQLEFSFDYNAVQGIDDKLASLEKQVRKLSFDMSRVLELLETKQNKKKVDKSSVI